MKIASNPPLSFLKCVFKIASYFSRLDKRMKPSAVVLTHAAEAPQLMNTKTTKTSVNYTYICCFIINIEFHYVYIIHITKNCTSM
jgi:hypothetical protein